MKNKDNIYRGLLQLSNSQWILYTLLVVMLSTTSSCNFYRQDILFKTDKEFRPELIELARLEAQRNYTIQKNDLIHLDIYTNKGERILDPNFDLVRELSGGGMGGGMMGQRMRPNPEFLVQQDGTVKLPVLGMVQLEGLTLNEANIFLEDLYSEYYIDPYVLVEFINKRVIVLGATGGTVVPLLNENTSLLEILALAGGLNRESKGNNIRLIRGDLDDPSVEIIDLSTIEGVRRAQLTMQSGDIVYVEPFRRIVSETLRDISPALGVVSSLITLIFIIDARTN